MIHASINNESVERRIPAFLLTDSGHALSSLSSVDKIKDFTLLLNLSFVNGISTIALIKIYDSVRHAYTYS